MEGGSPNFLALGIQKITAPLLPGCLFVTATRATWTIDLDQVHHQNSASARRRYL